MKSRFTNAVTLFSKLFFHKNNKLQITSYKLTSNCLPHTASGG
jgi:hypothetical protein